MLRIHVTTAAGQTETVEHLLGPIDFGRGPARDTIRRHQIVGDRFVSRDHLRLEELPLERVRVVNVSVRNSVRLPDTELRPGESAELVLPATVRLGDCLLSIESGEAPDPSAAADRKLLSTVVQPPIAVMPSPPTRKLADMGDTPDAATLAEWLERVIAVQRAAAGSAEFYQQTARTIVELIGLDLGLVLLRRQGKWEVVARAATSTADAMFRRGREFSRTVLDYLVKEKRTLYHAQQLQAVVESLMDVEAVVAAPFFDGAGEVRGALYGSRRRLHSRHGVGIGPLEAQLVQVLATAAGVGLARLEQEAEASRLRVQFQQFFSDALALELQRNPGLLEGQERAVTMLFCDIRRFSRLSERLGPRETCQLVSGVMEVLTDRVRQFDGVVMDYLGDGLIAMWNAPVDQPGHALMATRCALAMRAATADLSAQWQPVTGSAVEIGVGLNSGLAMVGNTGTKYKFKYGALGHAVNLASRVEGATKQFGAPVLLTGSTREQLGPSFPTRRLATVRVVGIAGAVDLYEPWPESCGAAERDFLTAYETALRRLEAGRFADARRAALALTHPALAHADPPTHVLLARVDQAECQPTGTFDPVLELKAK